MSTKDFKTRIRKHKFEEALKSLLAQNQNISDTDDIRKQALGLSSRFHQLKQEQSAGTLEDAEYRLQLNRITVALVELADEISDHRFNKKGNLPMAWTKEISIATILMICFVSGYFLLRNHIPTMEPGSMQLTLYVHGPKGPTDAVLEHTGKVIVDFGNDRRDPVIGENGRTNLGEIPRKFKNREIVIGLEAKGFNPADPGKTYLMYGTPIYYAVKPDNSLAIIVGIVTDATSLSFLEGVAQGRRIKTTNK